MKQTVVFLCVLIAVPMVVHATIINVPSNQPTIQSGIDAAVNGDTVLVAPGTYLESIDLNGRDILLTSSNGREETFIEPIDSFQNIVSIQTGEDTTCVIDGFTLRNAAGGWGVYCDHTSPIIRNCEIYNCNVDGDGGGIICKGSGGQIRGNKIHDNTCTLTGAGIVVGEEKEAWLTIVENEIYNNTSEYGPGIGCGASARTTTIARNILYNNVATGEEIYIGAIYSFGEDFEIHNNTVVSNTGGITCFGSAIDVRNNIVVWNDSIGFIVDPGTFDYNNVWNNKNFNNHGPNGISENPGFSDTSTHDYSLKYGSYCIDAGDPDPQYDDADGTRNDIGALPFTDYNFPVAWSVNFGSEKRDHIVDNIPTIYWSYFDMNPDPQSMYEIEVGTDSDWDVAEMWATGVINSSDSLTVYDGNPLIDGSTYFLRIRVAGNAEWGSWLELMFRMNSVPSTPELVIPNNGGIVDYTPLSVSVSSTDQESDYLSYWVQIAIDSNFIFPLELQGDGASGDTTDVVIESTLEENHEYWWRSKASDSLEESDYSGAASFIVNQYNEPPYEFSLILPGSPEGTRVLTLRPDFIWHLTTDPDPFDTTISFTLYVALDSNFTFGVSSPDIADTSYTIDYDLTWETDYWWKVEAEDLFDGTTRSTEVFRFYTASWICGDADTSSGVDIDDVVYLINYIFAGGPPPDPLASGDAECSGGVDIDDAVYLITYIFSGGTPPCDTDGDGEPDC